MRFWIFIFLVVILISCDDSRVYEEYSDFDNRYWTVQEIPSFEFTIQDTTQRYNLLGNVRNSVSYPFSRIFITYHLKDSTGKEIKQALVNDFLFDAKTGKPQGTSGLGDIYDHQIPLLNDHQFKAGKYSVSFEQFMRTDTLHGVLAVGLRVERAQK